MFCFLLGSKNRNITSKKMKNYYSSLETHRYVCELEARILALEAMMTGLPAEPYVVIAAQRALKKRNEYMRNFMAEKRRKERERVLSEQ